MKSILVGATMVFFLVAASAYAGDSRESQAKSFKAPSDQANVYISRKNETMGALIGFKVLVDGELVAEIQGGTFAFIQVGPGTHKIEVQAGVSSAQIDLKASAGKNYFYETGAKPKKALLEPEISLVILEPMGKMMINQSKLARSKQD